MWSNFVPHDHQKNWCGAKLLHMKFFAPRTMSAASATNFMYGLIYYHHNFWNVEGLQHIFFHNCLVTSKHFWNCLWSILVLKLSVLKRQAAFYSPLYKTHPIAVVSWAFDPTKQQYRQLVKTDWWRVRPNLSAAPDVPSGLVEFLKECAVREQSTQGRAVPRKLERSSHEAVSQIRPPGKRSCTRSPWLGNSQRERERDRWPSDRW